MTVSGRTIAIGDIHGCAISFDSLLDAIALQPEDMVITLGDYIDRGSDSKGIIDRLIALHQQGQLIPLKGNHEIMLLEARQSQEEERQWRKHGGKITLKSYAGTKENVTLKIIPVEHWQFVEKTCRNFWETETHFFVHANVDPHIPLAEQPEHKIFWDRVGLWRPPQHQSGKIMVCGHTAQRGGKPFYFGHGVCIDTYAYGGGWLTGLDVNSGRIWQTNQRGDTRLGWIDDFRI